MSNRRFFLKVGLAGSAVLAVGGLATWIVGRDKARDRTDVFGALIPVILAGALPPAPQARAEAIARCAAGVEIAISGLSPAAQDELAELVTLLALAPSRFAMTGITSSWSDAGADEIHAFLQRWRTHSWALLQVAYHALHDIVMGAWYGDEASWQAISYGGPVRL